MHNEPQPRDIAQERFEFASSVNALIWQANFDEVIYRDEYIAIMKVLAEIDPEYSLT